MLYLLNSSTANSDIEVHSRTPITTDMCQVTRVRLPCGHYNDYVDMACHDAKARKPLDNVTNSTDTNATRAKKMAQPLLRDDRSSIGFHATTEPHCLAARVRTLAEQYVTKEYACMVDGCR